MLRVASISVAFSVLCVVCLYFCLLLLRLLCQFFVVVIGLFCFFSFLFKIVPPPPINVDETQWRSV